MSVEKPAIATPAFPTTHVNADSAGLSTRDYFRAHAPAVPQFIVDEMMKQLRMEDNAVITAPWNDHTLRRLALLHRRWADAYADLMLADNPFRAAHNPGR